MGDTTGNDGILARLTDKERLIEILEGVEQPAQRTIDEDERSVAHPAGEDDEPGAD